MCCCSKSCLETTCKIFQAFVLIALILFIASFFVKMGKNVIWMVIFIFFYLIYIIFEFCSPMCKYLCRKTNNSGLKQLLGDLFNLVPVYKLHCECYHYETRTVRARASPPKKSKKSRSSGSKSKSKKSSSKKSGGRSSGGHKSSKPRYKTKTVTKKVVTHRETVRFAYKSCRDISGKFVLNCERKKAMGKAYVKLDLSYSIDFDSNDTQSDYNSFKNDFYNRNKKRDAHMNFNEKVFLVFKILLLFA